MTTPKKKPAPDNAPEKTAASPEKTANPPLSVGRIMHWRPKSTRQEGPGPFPAIVVQVDPLILTAFLPGHIVQLDEANRAELAFPERIG